MSDLGAVDVYLPRSVVPQPPSAAAAVRATDWARETDFSLIAQKNTRSWLVALVIQCGRVPSHPRLPADQAEHRSLQILQGGEGLWRSPTSLTQW
jgi:hypothetical protein